MKTFGVRLLELAKIGRALLQPGPGREGLNRMLPSPPLDRRGALGHLLSLPFHRLKGFAPSLRVRVPLVLFPECTCICNVRNFPGGQVSPSFKEGLPVERPLATEDGLDFPDGSLLLSF